MSDQPHCRWCGKPAEPGRSVHVGAWHCHACGRWQNTMACPCCGTSVSVERVEAYLGHPVGKAQEVIDGNH